jgi:ER lumen protein retaining receptor
MNKLRIVGDVCHTFSVVVFYAIARCRGNAAGVSLKAQELYLLVFVMRYIDLLTTFHSGYNTSMKLMFIFMTGLTVYTLKYIEPAKSTYSAAQDSYKHWSIVIFTGVFAMLIHLIGSGVVDIKGGSGEEFEVHFEKYEMFSFLWTFSICLEPFAMLPQLYIFWKNRHLNPEIRLAMFLKGSYRLFYIANWVQRGQNYENYQHHVLIYLAGGLQVLMYADFFLYPVL